MKIDYDPDADNLYLTFAEGESERTVEIEAGRVLVDVATGEEVVVGIEIYQAAQPWPVDEILGRWPLAAADADSLRTLYDEVQARGVVALTGATSADAG